MIITINNNNYKILENKETNILQICEFFNIKIPKFCYHDKLNVSGNCRMCLVEVEKSPKPVAACATPIMPGMKIFTDSPLVKKARENVLELLLVDHPLDCPICDQGGECDLQDNTLEYASDKNRNFNYHKRLVEDKNLGPIVKTIMTRCIHCTRCVRFIEKMTDFDTYKTFGRGSTTEIGTFIDKFIKTEFAGNLTDICPVGALTSKPYAFSSRSWELIKTKSVDTSDSIGSNILVCSRNESIPKNWEKNIKYKKYDKILRILPYYNENINESWISDKTRFYFDGIYNNRLEQPSLYVNSFDNKFLFKTKYFDYFKLFKNEDFIFNLNNYLTFETKFTKFNL